MRERLIGIFDSGLGGLTVARAVIDALPHESIVYFGDTGRYPYGPKPLEQVHAYATEIINLLDENEVKLIVSGCNSASSALSALGRPATQTPIIGVIDPPSQTAVRLTRNGRIGVIGTDATVGSDQYVRAIERTRRDVTSVTQAACPRFVEFVERGETTGDEILKVAHEYLDPLIAAQVDTVILGCTHFPLLSAAIQYVMGPDVLLVSSAEEAAKDVYTVLVANGWLSSSAMPTHRFLTSGDKTTFANLGAKFLGPEIQSVATHTWHQR